ncbi:PQ-loop repeat-containing protein 3 [Carlito syrichta]|uniref:PQ-loop repeat-containing protein 3 n=1 Tax=Carlito syrichta TaxID=1868482 RepID=A0A3Q0ECZ3_CARSF|nr:PQ-loop repeat-containing protein 3 [Carlito syrichta]
MGPEPAGSAPAKENGGCHQQELASRIQWTRKQQDSRWGLESGAESHSCQAQPAVSSRVPGSLNTVQHPLLVKLPQVLFVNIPSLVSAQRLAVPRPLPLPAPPGSHRIRQVTPAAVFVGSHVDVCPPLPRFLVFLRYQCHYGYPLLTYLEYPILIAQDVILLLCVFHFNGNVKQATPYIAVLGSSWFVLTLQKWIIDLAMNLCTLISAASKFAQLQCLWKAGDAGAVSALTWGLSSYTCATRIITTLMTTSDFTILTRFVIMLALNIWVTATVLRYRKTVLKAE